MDYALAHFNMIEQQIRPWDVLDMRILDVMSATPRHLFVPDGFESLAYSETLIPLNDQTVMLEPKIIGRFLQAANPQAHEIAFEVGTGSGYQTALLAQLCHHVDSVEIDAHLLDDAKVKIAQQGHQNVHFSQGNVYDLIANKQYDVIVVNGSVTSKPDNWLALLNVGGRCVVVVGSNAAMQAICYTRTEQHQWTEEVLFETEMAQLIGLQPVKAFSF